MKDLRIPVVFVDGTHGELSAVDVLRQQDDIADMAYGDRLMRASLLRHLVVWDADGIPDVAMAEFMQGDGGDKGGALPEALTIVERSTDNTKLFDAKLVARPIPLDEAVVRLMTVNTFCGYRTLTGCSGTLLPATSLNVPVFATLGQTIRGLREALDNMDEDVDWRAIFTYQAHSFKLTINDDGMATHAFGREAKPKGLLMDPMHLFTTVKVSSTYPDGIQKASVKSGESLLFAGLESVFWTADQKLGIYKVTEADGFLGWEVVARMTDANGQTDGSFSTKTMFNLGVEGAASYGAVYFEAKKLTTWAAKVSRWMRKGELDKGSASLGHTRAIEVVDIIATALREASPIDKLREDIAKLLLTSLDKASTERANPLSWANSKVRTEYLKLRKELMTWLPEKKTESSPSAQTSQV